jgi:hypothetical protein
LIQEKPERQSLSAHQAAKPQRLCYTADDAKEIDA